MCSTYNRVDIDIVSRQKGNEASLAPRGCEY